MPHSLPKLRGVDFHQIWLTSFWGHRAIYHLQTWYYQYTLLVPLWNPPLDPPASLRITGGCQTLSANPPIHACNVQEYFIPNLLHCRTESGALYPKVSSMNPSGARVNSLGNEASQKVSNQKTVLSIYCASLRIYPSPMLFCTSTSVVVCCHLQSYSYMTGAKAICATV
jgi:hypothetical protein